MTGVTRGARVRWPAHAPRKGTSDTTPAGTGVTLDHGPDAGTWWCSTGTGTAVLVKANQMNPGLSLPVV